MHETEDLRCSRLWAVEHLPQARSAAPLRAQNDIGLPKPEGRGSVARAKRRALTVATYDKRNWTYPKRAAGRRQRCSRHEPNSFVSRNGIMCAVGPTFCRSPGRVPAVPYSATQRVALKGGAEAPSQRTARGRVLRPSWAALLVGIAQAIADCATRRLPWDTLLL
jgi:hypothetical protein